jgi:hypothetical protein
MRISDLHSPYLYGTYKGRIAVSNGNRDTLYVFKDISLKRMDVENYSTFRKCKGVRIIYVSNKQLKTWTSSMGYIADIRAIVMDRKAGTTYKSKYKSGSYLFCD